MSYMNATRTAYFEVYADTAGHYRWRMIAGNGQNIANSGEAFYDKASATRSAENVKALAASAPVI